jgi:hypothetical protein
VKINPAGVITTPAGFRLLGEQGALGQIRLGPRDLHALLLQALRPALLRPGHLAELGGDLVSVNANTLDDFDPNTVPSVYWDGRHDNWHAGPHDVPWPVSAE